PGDPGHAGRPRAGAGRGSGRALWGGRGRGGAGCAWRPGSDAWLAAGQRMDARRGGAALRRDGRAARAVHRRQPRRGSVGRGGRVATHGWQQVSAWTPAELGRRFAEMGVRHALFTDVSRDGDLSGVAVEATAALARETGLAVIASGGVAGLDDLRALRAARDIAGVVIGKALYTGALRLEDALEAAKA